MYFIDKVDCWSSQKDP